MAVLLGQLTSPGPAPRPPTAVASNSASDLLRTPEPDRPIGVGSLRRCPVQQGGLALGSPQAHGSALERWDCAALQGSWSVVIRSTSGHFGVRSAVVTFPVELTGAGIPSTKPPGGVWKPSTQTLVFPLGTSHGQIVGDLGQSTLEDLAARITIDRSGAGGADRPHFSGLDGFTASATVTYRPAVVHEMRYSTADLGQETGLGDGLVYTGVMSGAFLESEAFESQAKPAGLVRGKPAIYSTVQGGSGTLTWQSAPGEVMYIGFSGSATEAHAIESLRALANKGRALTPAQWQTKDRLPVPAR
jgi:hypothetical protein